MTDGAGFAPQDLRTTPKPQRSTTGAPKSGSTSSRLKSSALPEGFLDFIGPEADRFGQLKALLEKRGLHPSVLDLAGSRHILLTPSTQTRQVSRDSAQLRVLVAHWDRARGSPGANDNSAAVFQLMEAATRLNSTGDDKWLVLFTDREEAASAYGPRGQGAYALAEGFKTIGLGQAEFYIFDACGRGDTVIISTAMDELLGNEGEDGSLRAKRSARNLRLKVLEVGRSTCAGRLLLAPTPFSDDVGFLAAGLTAQTITVLPANEAATLAGALRSKPELAATLVSREARSGQASGQNRRPDALWMPRTWTLLHSPKDDAASLTPSVFPLVERLVLALAKR